MQDRLPRRRDDGNPLSAGERLNHTEARRDVARQLLACTVKRYRKILRSDPQPEQPCGCIGGQEQQIALADSVTHIKQAGPIRQRAVDPGKICPSVRGHTAAPAPCDRLHGSRRLVLCAKPFNALMILGAAGAGESARHRQTHRCKAIGSSSCASAPLATQHIAITYFSTAIPRPFSASRTSLPMITRSHNSKLPVPAPWQRLLLGLSTLFDQKDN